MDPCRWTSYYCPFGCRKEDCRKDRSCWIGTFDCEMGSRDGHMASRCQMNLEFILAKKINLWTRYRNDQKVSYHSFYHCRICPASIHCFHRLTLASGPIIQMQNYPHLVTDKTMKGLEKENVILLISRKRIDMKADLLDSRPGLDIIDRVLKWLFQASFSDTFLHMKNDPGCK